MENTVNEPRSEWGGPWTEKKLNAFSKYVWSYLKIMEQNKFWKTIYFDGFAGSGSTKRVDNSELLLSLDITEDEQKTYQGAAERVLTVKDNLNFDFYYFIDKDENSLIQLEIKLRSKLNLENRQLAFRSGDANQWIDELSKVLKTKKYAALVFLDPFGMQINWNSIENLKDTRSDVWILVPTGVIVNRLLDRQGKLKYIDKLESFFGLSKDEIMDHFYTKQSIVNLFGDEDEKISKVSQPIHKIATLYAQKLKTIWKYVTEEPLRLDNRNGVPIFHFVFASNNKSAYKIASEIIKSV